MPAIGYARVSTDGQTLDAQIAQLTAAGAIKLFKEKVSGAKSDRTQLKKAIAALAEGDMLIVTRLDRLARSTRDLLNILANIADKGGSGGIRSPLSNRRTSPGHKARGLGSDGFNLIFKRAALHPSGTAFKTRVMASSRDVAAIQSGCFRSSVSHPNQLDCIIAMPLICARTRHLNMCPDATLRRLVK
jgi:hypothetical protein